MNYQKIYNDLIDRGKNRILECYSEAHHIIPRCMGGSDKPENLVELTPEEHYLAHQLLVKIYPSNEKLIFAAMTMTRGRKGNKVYGWLRKKHSELAAKQGMMRLKEKNGSFGTCWISNPQKLISKKWPKTKPIPRGWILGRNAWKKINAQMQREEVAEEKQEAHFIFVKKIWEQFLSNQPMSVNQFAKQLNKPTKTLSRWFLEYIPEYKKKSSQGKTQNWGVV